MNTFFVVIDLIFGAAAFIGIAFYSVSLRKNEQFIELLEGQPVTGWNFLRLQLKSLVQPTVLLGWFSCLLVASLGYPFWLLGCVVGVLFATTYLALTGPTIRDLLFKQVTFGPYVFEEIIREDDEPGKDGGCRYEVGRREVAPPRTVTVCRFDLFGSNRRRIVDTYSDVIGGVSRYHLISNEVVKYAGDPHLKGLSARYGGVHTLYAHIDGEVTQMFDTSGYPIQP